MAIDNKLKTAAQIRDENIKKMLVRLKEHVSAIGGILIFGCLQGKTFRIFLVENYAFITKSKLLAFN